MCSCGVLHLYLKNILIYSPTLGLITEYINGCKTQWVINGPDCVKFNIYIPFGSMSSENHLAVYLLNAALCSPAAF